MSPPDAVIVGSGPNGLAAAIVLGRAGWKVRIHEAAAEVGGGLRSAELTLPGFLHDVCSSVYPFATVSPLFQDLPLTRDLTWIQPSAMLAHPYDDGRVAVVERSIASTADGLGDERRAYLDLVGPAVRDWPRLASAVLGPVRWPRHPITVARFGLRALRSADRLTRAVGAGPVVRGLFAGIAAHGMLPLDRAPSAAFGLVLGALAHVGGWGLPAGGARTIAHALADYVTDLGGEIVVNSPVRSLDDLPPARAVICDLSPAPFVRLAGPRLPPAYKRRLERYRYGLGVLKVDWALGGPIPWRSADCARALTVHLGGSFDEIAASEREAWQGRLSGRPFVILVQPTIVDPSRAPEGRHTAWAYCHVPHASAAAGQVEAIERQIERFAPGFARLVLARSVMTPADIERRNPNLVGGDIAAGVCDIAQVFARPSWHTYRTPVRGLYLCSAATPPGAGVHGMCGYHAATCVLDDAG